MQNTNFFITRAGFLCSIALSASQSRSDEFIAEVLQVRYVIYTMQTENKTTAPPWFQLQLWNVLYFNNSDFQISSNVPRKQEHKNSGYLLRAWFETMGLLERRSQLRIQFFQHYIQSSHIQKPIPSLSYPLLL